MPDPAGSTPATDPAEVNDQSSPPPHQVDPPAPAGERVEQAVTRPAPGSAAAQPDEPAAAPGTEQAPAAANESASAGPPDSTPAPATEPARAGMTDPAPAPATGPAPASGAGGTPAAATEPASAGGADPAPAAATEPASPAATDPSPPAEAAQPAPPVPASTPAGTSTPAPASPPSPVSDVDPGDAPGGDDGEDVHDEPHEPGDRRDRKKIEIDARVVLALLVVAALAAGAFAFGTYQGNKARPPKTPQATGTTVFQTPKEFATLADPETGVKLSVPKNWAQYSTKELKDKAIRLIVGIPNTGDTVVVRVNSYSTEITEANLGDQKNVFDQLLGEEDIQIFVNNATTLGGLPALFYVYRFTDTATGTTGIHAHYFVFQGRKMVSLIFQALPEPRYQTLAETFDRIANSLEVDPGPPPAFLEPAVTTTVAPGATPTPGATPDLGASPAPAPPAPPTTG